MSSNPRMRQEIRALFLHPGESYNLAEVACFTGAPLSKLRRKVADGITEQRQGAYSATSWHYGFADGLGSTNAFVQRRTKSSGP
jgi:hypothetical protein